MGEWEPDDVASMDGFRHVYLWIVPANVDGTWEVTAGGVKYPLVLEQFFQRMSGSVQLGGKVARFRDGHLDGVNVIFEANAMSGNGAMPALYTAKAVGAGRLEGTIEIGGRKVPFTALRTGPSPPLDAPRSK
jgi:hypothetical protein